LPPLPRPAILPLLAAGHPGALTFHIMAVLLRIPTPLRKLTGGKAEVAAEGASVREVLDNVEASHPGMRDKILEPSGGSVRRFINVFVNGEDIRHIQGLDTRLKPGDELSIVPAIAGGAAGLERGRG